MDVGPSIANRTIAAQEAVASSAMMMMVVMALETPASMTGCAGNQNRGSDAGTRRSAAAAVTAAFGLQRMSLIGYMLFV